MRALHVLESLEAGGVETTFLNVLRHFPPSALTPRGRHDTHDVLALAGGALEPEYRAVAARLFIERGDNWRAIVRDGEYDVVYVLFERAALALLPLLSTTTSTPVVYGKNYDFSGQWRSTEGFRWTVDDALVAACDGVTFTTDALAAAYAAEDRARGLVLGKAADVHPLLALGPPDVVAPNRVLAVANPTPRKRLGDLIAALGEVRRCVPDATLKIVGSGDPLEVRRLLAQAADSGLGAAVNIAGGTRDVGAELALARVVALSSGCEGVPTALLEAMAAARPVVTTDAGHVRSIVDDGVEGFVVPVGDVDGLGDRLARLLMNRPLAASMGRSGRARALHHAVEAVAARLASYLQRVAAEPVT